jgi:hypothetical protein
VIPRFHQSIEYFQEAHGGFAVWIDPFRIFHPEVLMNLLPEFGVVMDLARHGNPEGVQPPHGQSWLGDDLSVGRHVDQLWRCENAPRPSEGVPKSGMHMLAVCTTPGQLVYFVALALQQYGQQPALRKGRG